MGSGQTGSDEGETERSQVPHRGGVLEATDIFCQWFGDKLYIFLSNWNVEWIWACSERDCIYRLYIQYAIHEYTEMYDLLNGLH